MMKDILKSIRNGETLPEKIFSDTISMILDGHCSPAQIGALLMGLSQRGESVDEITGAAKILRARASTITAPAGAIDCCGTGGDHSNSLNISTAVAFVVAACGVPVAKHGNRAASSKSGAADVLEALGIQLDLSPLQCEQALQEIGFCFLMAPHHHSSLKPLAALRKELGFRTIFNLLGPLANPAGTKRQLLGVFDKSFVRPMAESLLKLGSEAAMVVHGEDGMDEITLSGRTYCAELRNGHIIEYILTPDDFRLPSIQPMDILGGDATFNGTALMELLNGADNAYRRIVLANSAAALLIADKVQDLKSGVEMAAHAIDQGNALNILSAYCLFTQKQVRT
ncbi:MAG: anthranilate phosphoribosyltransferase [Alphaproteobacteria bacterium]|nr:anthranilate phosphoribosyltransferase [Alphaproteobacteria bacterium]